VHDNIIAEIVNRSVQFFNSDGTPLTNLIRGSEFFLVGGANIVDPQAFFDSKSKRWYFHAIIPIVPMVSGEMALAVIHSRTSTGITASYA
jgi:hypothetical protein